MVEIWKDIEGYEGLYEVSNTGKVRSMNYKHTGNVKELKPLNNGRGYLIVQLYKDRKMKSYMVHRLVAKAFLEDWSMWFSEINHKDEDKTNNSVDNLEYSDRKYNINYGTRNERMVQTRIRNGNADPNMCGRFDKYDSKEYMKQYQRQYYLNNRDRIREYKKAHKKKS